MKSYRCSSDKISGGNFILRYTLPTAAGMLILSIALKTAGQLFYLITAVLLLIMGSVLSIFLKKRGLLFSAVLLCLFCIRIMAVITGPVERSYDNNGSVDYISATVTNTPTYYNESSNYGYCTVKIEGSQKGLLEKGSLLCLVGEGVAGLNLGDSTAAKVRLSPFDNKQINFSFYSENVFVRGECIEPVVAYSKSKGIYGFSGKVNEYAKTHLIQNTDNYGMLLAVITGERSYISDEFYGQVKTAGVSHALVVSGMHLAILCGTVFKLLSLLKGADWIKDLLLLIFLFLMMCVCGFGMSVLRASVVYIFAVLYRRMKRLGDSLLFLANAVVIVLFIHPYAAYSVAFQLSFASTFGILVLAQRIIMYLNRKKFKNTIVKYVIEAATVSISAYLATLPIVIYNFGYISTYAIPVNILLSLPSTLMLVLGVLGLIFGAVPFMGKILLTCADIIADFFAYVVKLACNLPLPEIPLRNEKLLAVLILVFAAAAYIIKRKPYKILSKKG